ncbi:MULTISPECIES: NAD(P)-dependent oxidoreductase [Streptomycetaceae]|uniref:Dehydrogenase n=1 Tax=Streptantibioticus cattleyicolor (strain ATCC 35852 / DSM 46488 / JCM 4925 / NBRC 14057 / NRRL 8057) TaxID=1003195 RepID=F8K4B5_STREN|nr:MULTISPECIES: NAD(P)-dependent oxidoreductase [Streptomycetaceae]AEW93869.1 dehydrogenase [Streptantibioticus cattleyicolor NRRL 8057 = DSM 46488]MYS58552.1 NAD-binding protein [Streptomyces sp. SID5468]CCB74217.1 putative dehydrogenase [Streptantibioticus cattleyicolor NRRL 8057 = DSM 46488]
MQQKITVAVLGTGIMGAAMARNLLKAGHGVRAWNRTRSRAEPLADDGAYVAGDPADAVRGADAVLTVLLDGPATLEAIRAAAPGLAAGTVWCQAATVGPQAQRELAGLAAEHGVHFVDSPVLGTRLPAEKGQLQVLAAGAQESRPVADRIFDAIGQKTFWLAEDGATGYASKLKLVVNAWVLTLINGATETFALAEGLGVRPEHLLDALDGTLIDSPYLRMKGKVIMDGAYYPPSFTVSGVLKDARLIARAGEEAGVHMDLTNAAAERLSRAEHDGHGDKDGAAAYLSGFRPTE